MEEKEQKPDVIIQLRVVDQNGQEVLFKIKKTTQLKKLMDAYCDRKGITDRGAVRFSFNGERIREDSTPKELGIEENDSIDVLLQQVGGTKF